MTPEQWTRVKSALGDALDLEGSKRAAYVESLRRTEPHVAGEVARLLAQHQAAGGFMETPAAVLEPLPELGASGSGRATAEGQSETQIGPFLIVGVLGEGGMGIVYRAEQESPRRSVALKVIRPGLAGEATLRRFEHEAEALGRLQHPGIAQVYQAGTAGSGRARRPYFAMELVQGSTLTEFAAQRGMSTRQRLELFIVVCDAVQHAHMKGVIHRDLKPANIIVGADGRPKVLDFGIARVTDSDVRSATVQTSVGQIVGTVPFMSPEQIAGDPADLDTRSDVYSLGVVLYELLAGRLPYELAEKSIIEAARVIRETVPTRLSQTARTLRGDLETIVGKALEKDKRRRYQSAAELGADLQRFLRQEPVSARRPSAIYQIRKFGARNRVLVGAAAAIFLVLIGAVVALTVERTRTRDALAAVTVQRNRASDALAEATEARNKAAAALAAVTIERNKAQTEAAKSDAIVEFLKTMLTSADPAKTKGHEVTVREILDTAAAAIEQAPLSDAEADATARALMGETYWKLGVLDRAEQMFRSAAETAERRLGPDHDVTLTALGTLALVYNEQGRPKESGALTERVYEAKMRTVGERDPGTLSAMNNVARWWGGQGRYDEALALMRRVVELRTEILGPSDRKTLISLDNLGRLLYQSGHAEEAESWHRRALEGFTAAFGEDDPQTLGAIQNLAETTRKLGRLTEAEGFMRRAVEGRRRVLGERNLFTIGNINYLGRVLMDEGKHAEAEPLLRESVELATRVVGPDHQYTVGWQVYLGTCLGALGKFEEAEGLLLDAHKRACANPENASRVPLAADALAKLYERSGRTQEAAAWREKAAPTKP